MPKMPEKPKDFGPNEVLRVSVDANAEGFTPRFAAWMKGYSAEKIGAVLAGAVMTVRMALEQLPPNAQAIAAAAFMQALAQDIETPKQPDAAVSFTRERGIDP